MTPALTQAPIARWVRKCALILKEDRDDYLALVNHPNLDLNNLLKQEIDFRQGNGINLVGQVKGPPGSGKSKAVALRLALMLNPNWRPKNNVVYTDDDLINAAKKAGPGWVGIKDEDPREHGQGTGGVSDALANLESAVARFAEMHFIFVNPYDTGHLVSFVFDTSPQISRRQDGLLISVIADMAAKYKDEETLEERWLKIGKLEMFLPDQKVVQEYESNMAKFKNELRATGGRGIRSDVFKRYEDLIPILKVDEDFQAIPVGRGGFFTERHCKYISSYHHVVIDEADVFLLKAWKLVKNPQAVAAE